MLVRPMPKIFIQNFDDPRIADYKNLRDVSLRRDGGRFMVEGRGTLRVLLEASRFRPRSILVSPAAFDALVDVLDPRREDVPIFVASRALLKEVVGFDLHRGCLAACDRGEEPSPEELFDRLAGEGGGLVVVLEGLKDHDNVGAVFRNAMGFGAKAVLLDPRCADPLYRKSIRTSMGGALRVPFTRAKAWPAALEALRAIGYRIIALHPAASARAIDEVAADFGENDRVALVVGTEGGGLSNEVLRVADLCVRIPIAEGVDSLNVATASGIALHAFAAPRLVRANRHSDSAGGGSL